MSLPISRRDFVVRATFGSVVVANVANADDVNNPLNPNGVIPPPTAPTSLIMSPPPPLPMPAPIANDDDLSLLFSDALTAMPLDPLANDSGADLEIVSVAPSSVGATITIDSSGMLLWYTPPTGPEDVTSSMGGPLPLSLDDMPESTDGLIPSEGPGGWNGALTDQFGYGIQDNTGAVANALCQVNARAVGGTWTHSLAKSTAPDHDEVASRTPAQVGIDGKPGYNMWIRNVFGKNMIGPIKGDKGGQFWQANNCHNQYVLIKGGKLEKQGRQEVIGDVVSSEGRQRPVVLPDNLALLGVKAGETALFVFQVVDKKQGLINASGNVTLKPKVGFRANEEEKKKLETMSPPFLEMRTLYIFVDKSAIEAKHNDNTIGDADYEKIKSEINKIMSDDVTGFGVTYDAIGNTYERLKVGDLGDWTFP